MRYLIIFLTLFIGSNRAYFGLEEVEVTFKSVSGIQSYFEAVITIVPHTENIVLWYCKIDELISYYHFNQ